MELDSIYSDGRGVVFRSGRLGSSAGRYLMHTGTTDEPLVKDKHVAPDFTALGVGRVSSSLFWVCGVG